MKLVVLAALPLLAHAETPILSVCEVLDHRLAYNGKVVIVVGRVGGTTEGTWLDQECGHKLLIDGHEWGYDISLTDVSPPTEPAPSIHSGFRWNTAALVTKLAEVQKTTFLQMLKPHGFEDRWRAVYGRFETHEEFHVIEYSTGERGFIGFGHMNGSPARIVWPEDGTFDFASMLPKRTARDQKRQLWREIKGSLMQSDGPNYFELAMQDKSIPALRGTVVSGEPSFRPKVLILSLSGDNTAEATLHLDRGFKRRVPPGAVIEFEGVARSFTPDPLMLHFDVPKSKLTILRTPATRVH